MSAAPDPGPAPSSLTVRALRPREGEGFYARLSPRPMPRPRTVLATLGTFGGIGALLGVWFGSDVWLRVEIASSIVGFGVLLQAFSHLAGWFPVEIIVDDHNVNWNGERIPMHTVRRCEARDGTLVLYGEHERVLATVEHIAPDAARWLALAIEASIPTPG